MSNIKTFSFGDLPVLKTFSSGDPLVLKTLSFGDLPDLKTQISKVIGSALVIGLLATSNAGAALASHNSVDYQASINRGLNYLKSQQQTDGSIAGFGGISDWASIAFASNQEDVSTIMNPAVSLKQFLLNNPPTTTSSASDWERAILAIVAIGENPATFGGINYVQNLESKFNSNQLGDSSLVNDDIFGLLALLNSGSTNNAVKVAVLNFIINEQNSDGGFSWSTTGFSDSNDTAAAIQALQAARNNRLGEIRDRANTSRALSKAKRYLYSTQNEDGGFGYDEPSPSDGSSSAWALIALNGIGQDNSSKARKVKNYLVANQMTDGGYPWQSAFGSDTYTTSHALVGLSGKSWLLN